MVPLGPLSSLVISLFLNFGVYFFPKFIQFCQIVMMAVEFYCFFKHVGSAMKKFERCMSSARVYCIVICCQYLCEYLRVIRF